jgi:hypothetical protein
MKETLDQNSLNVLISYMISEFLYERGKKKCRKYIKNKERKKEKGERLDLRKMQKSKGENKS